MKKSSLSLKWLEVFHLIARTGSMQGAADEAGLSVSTVSHHLKQLETALNTQLFDHNRRPLRVTSAGASFLRHTDEALKLLRQAETEVHATGLSDTRHLGLALIEDFDSEIGPELARTLAANMPKCAFRHLTRPSHEILTLLRRNEIQIGVASRPQFDQDDLVELPLLRDPFVLSVPTAALGISPEDYLADASGLPLLRYSHNQIMGTQIDQHLRRLRVTLPNRFEFESNQSIMNMVADGNGWAITTPTNYMRARRFQRQISLIPFPGKSFARYLSVFATSVNDETLTKTVSDTMRQLVLTQAIAPALERHPWLAEIFTLLPDQP